MATISHYNALIKSLPSEKNVRGEVTGRILLSDLNLVPPKWTLLFRGKKLSRDVNMAKLLCSPEDPIIIYKGIVKLPGFQTDFPKASSSSQENSNIKLPKPISRESRKPAKRLKLTNDDRVEKNCKLGAEMKSGNLNSGLRITEFYKIYLEESTDKLTFINTKYYNGYTSERLVGEAESTDQIKLTNTKCKIVCTCKGLREDVLKIRRKNRQKFFKARNMDTVDFLKKRICATFKADPEKHHIYYLGKKRVDSERLEVQGFIKGLLVKLDFEREPEEMVKGRKKKEVLGRRAVLEETERMKEEKIQWKLEMLGWPEEKKLQLAKQRKEKEAAERKWRNMRSVGGGGPCPRPQKPSTSFQAQNVDRRPLTLVGEKPKYTWNLYSFGMNLYGTCSNKRCISRKKMYKNENGVSHTAGYGNIILTPERVKFPCSACKELFPVKEFVLCGGRSLFRFKKSGVGEAVETVLIESEDDIMKHKTFDDTEEGEGVETSSYDFIEITTVKVGYGVYCCIKCNEMIKFKQDENVLRCGHVYHNECTTVYVGGDEDDSIVGCDACNAEEVEDLYDMLGMERENLNSEAALMRSN